MRHILLRLWFYTSCYIEHLPPAHGDITLIRQVLTNLLSNAVKFTGAKDLVWHSSWSADAAKTAKMFITLKTMVLVLIWLSPVFVP